MCAYRVRFNGASPSESHRRKNAQFAVFFSGALPTFLFRTGLRSLGTKTRKHFACRRRNGGMTVLSVSTFRNVLTKMEPSHLDHVLQGWNETSEQQDINLAIDGKTMCNAVNKKGWQPHTMSVIAHQTKITYIRFPELCSYWLQRLRDDPLYFFKSESRCRITKELDKLGRRLIVSDFE